MSLELALEIVILATAILVISMMRVTWTAIVFCIHSILYGYLLFLRHHVPDFIYHILIGMTFIIFYYYLAKRTDNVIVRPRISPLLRTVMVALVVYAIMALSMEWMVYGAIYSLFFIGLEALILCRDIVKFVVAVNFIENALHLYVTTFEFPEVLHLPMATAIDASTILINFMFMYIILHAYRTYNSRNVAVLSRLKW